MIILCLSNTWALGHDLTQERTLAISILASAATQTSSPQLQQVYQRITQTLRAIKFKTSIEENDFEACKNTKRLAYFDPAPLRRNSLFLCRQTLDEGSLLIAQVLIHEGAHAAGYPNECQAASFERSAMLLAGYPLANYSYQLECGF